MLGEDEARSGGPGNGLPYIAVKTISSQPVVVLRPNQHTKPMRQPLSEALLGVSQVAAATYPPKSPSQSRHQAS